MGKLYDQIKFSGLDRNILGDFNNTLNKSIAAVGNQPHGDAAETNGDRARLPDVADNGHAARRSVVEANNSNHVTNLSAQMSTLDLDQNSDAAKLRASMEKSARFYAQLYDVLSKRKQLPVINANFEKLSLFAVEYSGENVSAKNGGAASGANVTINNMNEASFLNFKTASMTPIQANNNQPPAFNVSTPQQTISNGPKLNLVQQQQQQHQQQLQLQQTLLQQLTPQQLAQMQQLIQNSTQQPNGSPQLLHAQLQQFLQPIANNLQQQQNMQKAAQQQQQQQQQSQLPNTPSQPQQVQQPQEQQPIPKSTFAPQTNIINQPSQQQQQSQPSSFAFNLDSKQTNATVAVEPKTPPQQQLQTQPAVQKNLFPSTPV